MENKVVGNCGKHPGQSMINCPICAAETNKRLLRNILCPKYVVTTWGAVLKLKRINKSKQLVTVSDPKCIDAGMDIGINDVVLMAREKI